MGFRVPLKCKAGIFINVRFTSGLGDLVQIYRKNKLDIHKRVYLMLNTSAERVSPSTGGF